MLHFLAGAPMTNGNPMSSTIIMIVVMIGVFYFMLIRPENKRKKEAEQLRSNIKVGDQVTTIGGIVGTVVNVKEDKFVIETSADQVRIEFQKWALSTNETAAATKKEEEQKAAEAKAKAKAAKEEYRRLIKMLPYGSICYLLRLLIRSLTVRTTVEIKSMPTAITPAMAMVCLP